ncbi:MAG: type II toxin-antitoxin system tRNA(fMet)-specific endonuclease VapC [Acidobacteriota bacterium]
MKFLLDTNVCIYSLNRRPPEVLQRLREVGPAAVAISVITVVELRHGAAKSQNPSKARGKLDRFLKPLSVLDFDREAAEAAGRIRADLERAGTPVGDLDSLIAAHALSAKLTLVSNNLREFDRVPGLRTENWVAS